MHYVVKTKAVKSIWRWIFELFLETRLCFCDAILISLNGTIILTHFWLVEQATWFFGLLRPYYLAVSFSCCLVTSLPHCLAALLPCCLVALLPCCLVAWFPYQKSLYLTALNSKFACFEAYSILFFPTENLKTFARIIQCTPTYHLSPPFNLDLLCETALAT